MKCPDVGGVNGSEYTPAQHGNYYLDLSGKGNAHPTLSAFFPTWQGFSYLLTFYVGSATNVPGPTINAWVFDERTNLNVTVTAFPPTNGVIAWTKFQFTWTASHNGAGVFFKDVSTNDDNGSFIDNVRVEPNPPQLEPFSITSLQYGQRPFIDPGVGWIVTWQARPSFTYQVFYKDSSVDPVWMPLSDPFLVSPGPSPYQASYQDRTGGPQKRFYQVLGK